MKLLFKVKSMTARDYEIVKIANISVLHLELRKKK